MHLRLTIFGREVFCFDIERDFEFCDWDEISDEDDEEEEEDEEEEVISFRWGEPACFERDIFVPEQSV